MDCSLIIEILVMGDILSLTSGLGVQRRPVQKVHLWRVLTAPQMKMPLESYHLVHQCHLLLIKLVQQQPSKFGLAEKDMIFIVHDV